MSLCHFTRAFVTPSAPQAHVAHSAICSRTVWRFTECHTLSEHLVQSGFYAVGCFVVQTADGTTEDADANASIDRCQLLPECFRHLWLSLPNILTCHVSKDLVLAKFYVIHTVNILTFHILKNEQNTLMKTQQNSSQNTFHIWCQLLHISAARCHHQGVTNNSGS